MQFMDPGRAALHKALQDKQVVISRHCLQDSILSFGTVQPADIGWPTGNGKKVSNSQACCLAQLCLAAA